MRPRSLATTITMTVTSLCLATLGGLTPMFDSTASAAGRTTGRANVVLITADDMRADDLRFMPFTRGEFRRRGVTFADGLSPYPLCCPARAQIVTGQYNHNNGVRGNTWPNGGYWALKAPDNTLPTWLRRRGYLTGFVGKYMNGYDKDPRRLADPQGLLAGRRRAETPAGWSHWYASIGSIYAYTRVRMLTDTPTTAPRRRFVDQYQTEYFNDVTTSLIRRYHRAKKPFFIWASHLAPHRARRANRWVPPVPAARDRGAYRSAGLPHSRAFREAFNEPAPTLHQPPVRRDEMLRLHRARAESLRSVDRAVRDAVMALKRTGEYARTTIIFTSDNGFLLGEHRLVGKDLPYEPALRVPMIVNGPAIKRRYRPAAGPGAIVTVPYTVTITDIASTVVGATAATPGRTLDGIDMTRPRQNPDHAGGDRAVLIESGAQGRRLRTSERFAGVRTNRWSWFAWNVQPDADSPGLGAIEHYDRRRSPGQTEDLPADARQGRQLADLLVDLHDCTGSGCVRELL
jgi:N-acetylglucosamine-6-sulfatase